MFIKVKTNIYDSTISYDKL